MKSLTSFITEVRQVQGHNGQMPLMNQLINQAYAPSKYAHKEIHIHVSAPDKYRSHDGAGAYGTDTLGLYITYVTYVLIVCLDGREFKQRET